MSVFKIPFILKIEGNLKNRSVTHSLHPRFALLWNDLSWGIAEKMIIKWSDFIFSLPGRGFPPTEHVVRTKLGWVERYRE